MKIPFKTPVDYFVKILGKNYNNIDHFKELFESHKIEHPGWKNYDCDLHIYPYTVAMPALLSVGCPNQCSFCPTAQTHKGKIFFGDYKVIIPKYEGQNIHFMDENFFYNDMKKVLPLLKKYKITWLAMSDYESTKKVIEEFGDHYLYKCGLRVVEVGLENVVLYKKVQEKLHTKKVVIYYLNMTCLPGETKASIAKNAEWMQSVSLKNPIHLNNGIWYTCGQFFYPYRLQKEKGRYLEGKLARVRPTWIPNTLLVQSYQIVNLEAANWVSQLVYNIKIYNPKTFGSIGNFIGTDQKLAAWMLSGIRCGAIR